MTLPEIFPGKFRVSFPRWVTAGPSSISDLARHEPAAIDEVHPRGALDICDGHDIGALEGPPTTMSGEWEPTALPEASSNTEIPRHGCRPS